MPDLMPKSLLVVGSGAIGIEFASFYRNDGRRGDGGRGPARVLPVEDAEISGPPRRRSRSRA